MKERLFIIMAAGILLAAVTLPILFSALSLPDTRANARQTGFAQVARWGIELKCQSGTACGG